MAYNETGHAKNVANFNELILAISSLGAVYQPPVEVLKVAVLLNQKTELEKALQAVNNAVSNYKNAIYARQQGFEKMNTLASRITAMLAVLGVDAKMQAEAKSLSRKISGSKTAKKTTTPEVSTNPTETPAVESKTVSTSQQSFDQRRSNFDRLLALLQSQPSYAPNEEDIKLANLQTYHSELGKANDQAIQTERELIKARQQRDDLLYTEQSGAVAIAFRIKEYIKSIYGANTNEYKRIAGIKFITRRTAS
jgi:Uncharacterized protein conserved in bacteria (DUF2225)